LEGAIAIPEAILWAEYGSYRKTKANSVKTQENYCMVASEKGEILGQY
jgi:hypothetical protein